MRTISRANVTNSMCTVGHHVEISTNLQPPYSIFLDTAQQHFQVIFGSKVGEGIWLRKQEDTQEEKHMRTLSRTHQQETTFLLLLFLTTFSIY